MVTSLEEERDRLLKEHAESLRHGTPRDRFHARRSMVEAGPIAVPLLVDLLHDPSAEARSEALHTLWNLGVEARSATDSVMRLLHDPEDGVRWWVLRLIDRISPPLGPAAPTLISLLDHPYVRIREITCHLLPRCGRRGKAAIPQLIRMIERPLPRKDASLEVDVKIEAACALWSLQGPNETTLRSLRGFLDNGEEPWEGHRAALVVSRLVRQHPGAPGLDLLLDGAERHSSRAVVHLLRKARALRETRLRRSSRASPEGPR